MKNNIEDTLEKLFLIVSETFDTDKAELSGSTNAREINGWDSVSHVGLILAIESQFSIQFEILDVLKVKNLAELAALIYKYQSSA